MNGGVHREATKAALQRLVEISGYGRPVASSPWYCPLVAYYDSNR